MVWDATQDLIQHSVKMSTSFIRITPNDISFRRSRKSTRASQPSHYHRQICFAEDLGHEGGLE
ncbi:hypothetical protein K0M31_002243 [Melipona bicolor]|uniref:Uncharacterized protein n=1 Tax=Melipona bicolor TaxID=60889 RepID=A0AA40KYC5_9HYME|nr:hypothetical protein K0M31_002243 [Melipona bicolor]